MIYNTELWVGRDVEGSLWYRPGILQGRQRKTLKISKRAAGVPVDFRTGNLQKP